VEFVEGVGRSRLSVVEEAISGVLYWETWRRPWLLRVFSIVLGEEEELAGVLGVFVNFSMAAGGAGGESVFIDLDVIPELRMVMVVGM
jgi:hypothetical protein